MFSYMFMLEKIIDFIVFRQKYHFSLYILGLQSI